MDSFTPTVSYSPNKYCKVTVKCQEINQVYENVDYDLDAKQAGQNVDVERVSALSFSFWSFSSAVFFVSFHGFVFLCLPDAADQRFDGANV